jgi:hypothetical protein
MEDIVKTVAKAMTIQQTTNKELKKQWRDLDMQLQLTEKELFKQNLDTVTGIISEFENFKARMFQLETYGGSAKNRMEEYIIKNDEAIEKIKKKINE